MAGREPSESELAAATIVADDLGGMWVSRDGAAASDGMHDFDVELPDGRRVALEVTGAINEQAVRLSEAAYGTEGRERRWPAEGLANDWLVVIPPRPVKVARLMHDMVPILTLFEREGLTQVNTSFNPAYRRSAPGTPPAVIEATLRVFKMGVLETRVLWPRPEAQAQLFVTVRGGFSADIERVNDLVVQRAESKIEKLTRAEAAERHLFVWLDGTQPEAELAVATGPPPTTAPHLSPVVDVVWLATPPLTDPQRLWRVRPPGDWQVLR
jgi:hypothetical protein